MGLPQRAGVAGRASRSREPLRCTAAPAALLPCTAATRLCCRATCCPRPARAERRWEPRRGSAAGAGAGEDGAAQWEADDDESSALGGSGSSAARRSSGRPARRANPLGASALLSSYNATALSKAMGFSTALSPQAVAQATGYGFTHKEAVAMALMHPSLAVSAFAGSALTHSHLALLGEDLLRLAAMDLVWAALEGPPPAPAASQAGGRGPGRSLFRLLSGLGQPPAEEAPHVPLTAQLLNRAAAAVTGAVPRIAEQWQVARHMEGFGSAPGKAEVATCCKALVGATYLDGGWARGARRALALPVADVLRSLGAQQPDLQEVGRRLEAHVQHDSLPRSADDLHAAAAPGGAAEAGPAAQAPGLPVGGSGTAGASARNPHAVLANVLRGLREVGQYQPLDAARFTDLSDAWWQHLCGGEYPLTLAGELLSGEARQAHMTLSAARMRALAALGAAVYGVAVTELLLEREAAAVDAEQRARMRDNAARRAAAEAVRRGRAALLEPRVRAVQAAAALRLSVDAREPGQEAGAEGGEAGRDDGKLARVADGVLGVVALEGGMRHARAVARGLVEVGEAMQVVVQEVEELL